ncbi:FHA domain-containing protein [Schumannella soli]|uniref:FHA domain-containing protein n=1 Tax=Schumannella soli TaxID=2590779 RepID=A0A506Y8L0_9MICO|nr:FHA domain-containing protein [Schumannella soli]TPW77830.1 FHA domain-containing protein [Schumannella soli]
MSSSDATGIGVIGIVVSLISVLISVGVYVWLGLMLSKLFPHFGSEAWRGWVPVLNVAEILHIGGYSRLLVLLSFVPGGNIVVVIFTALSAHKIDQRLGKPTWYVVLALVLMPLWAMLLLRGLGGQSGSVAAGAGQQAWAGPGYGSGAGVGGAAAPGSASASGGSVAIPVPMTGAGSAPAPGYAGHDAYAGYGAQPAGAPGAESAPGSAPAPAAYGDPSGYGAYGQQPAYGQPSVPGQQSGYGQSSVGDAVDAALAAAAGHPGQPGAVSAPDWGQATTASAPAAPAPLIESPGFSVTSSSGAAPSSAAPVDGSIAAPAADGAGNYVITPPPGLVPPAASAAQQPVADEPSWATPPQAPVAGPHAPVADPQQPEPASAEPAPVADPGPSPWSRPPVVTVDPQAAVGGVGSAAGIVAPPAAGAAVASGVDPLGLGPVPGAPGSAAAPGVADEDDDDFGATIVVDPSATVRWELSLDDGPTYQLIGGTVVLGRKPAGTDPSVHYLAVRDATRTLSKVHARLDREGDTWRIRDLGSTNGVRVIEADGSEHPVPAGDGVLLAGRRFVLGRVAMHLDRLGGGSAAAEAAEAASRVESEWDTEDRS